jgi:hypothetical protein
MNAIDGAVHRPQHSESQTLRIHRLHLLACVLHCPPHYRLISRRDDALRNDFPHGPCAQLTEMHVVIKIRRLLR